MARELPVGWMAHQRTVSVPLDTLFQIDSKLQPALTDATHRYSEASLAFNLVRKVRGPACFPGAGFYTGLEGYFVGHCSESQMRLREQVIGQALEKKIKQLAHPLRRQVREALLGSSYAIAAISWLDAELGAILARLRCVGYETYDQNNLRANTVFQHETYQRLQTLSHDQRWIVTETTEEGANIEYPLPTEAVAVTSIPQTEAEVYISEIGKFGLPLFRALARTRG